MDAARHLKEMDTSYFTPEQLRAARQRQLDLQDQRNREWNDKHWNNRASRRAKRRRAA